MFHQYIPKIFYDPHKNPPAPLLNTYCTVPYGARRLRITSFSNLDRQNHQYVTILYSKYAEIIVDVDYCKRDTIDNVHICTKRKAKWDMKYTVKW